MRSRNIGDGSQSGHAAEGDASAEDDPLVARFKELYNASEDKIVTLFGSTGEVITPPRIVQNETPMANTNANGGAQTQPPAPTSKKRKLDDDDYDDFDEDDDEEDLEDNASPLKGRSNKGQIWHGIPIANKMDGVPGLTQPPIGAGKSYVYDFLVPVSGTYWYHSHSGEQNDRGLYGPLIVEPKQKQRAMVIARTPPLTSKEASAAQISEPPA